jgi:hypothetical protein
MCSRVFALRMMLRRDGDGIRAVGGWYMFGAMHGPYTIQGNARGLVLGLPRGGMGRQGVRRCRLGQFPLG